MPVTIPSAYFYPPPRPAARIERPSDRPYVALGVANTGSGAITLRIGSDSWPVAPATQTVLPLPPDQVPISLTATAFTRVSFTWYLPSDMDAANGIGGSLSQYQSGAIAGPRSGMAPAAGTVTTANVWQLAAPSVAPPTYCDLVVLSNTGTDAISWYLTSETESAPVSDAPPYFTQAAGAPPISLPVGGIENIGVYVTSATAGAAYAVLFSGT